MKKFFKLVPFVFILITSQSSYGQVARLLDYKDVKEMKNSDTYFILIEDQDERNTVIKKAIKQHWSFNQIKFEYFKDISSINDDENTFMIGIPDGSITMGKGDPGDMDYSSIGNYTSFSALFVSSRIKESTFKASGKWDGGIFTQNPDDIIQFFPLYVKTLNSMLIQIEENETKRFNASTAEKTYNSNSNGIENRTVYILKDQFLLYSFDNKKINKNSIKKLYEGDIKIVERDELVNAIEYEEDVIFLHFYKELNSGMYSAISCRFGNVVAFGTKKTPQYGKFMEWSLKDLNQY